VIDDLVQTYLVVLVLLTVLNLGCPLEAKSTTVPTVVIQYRFGVVNVVPGSQPTAIQHRII